MAGELDALASAITNENEKTIWDMVFPDYNRGSFSAIGIQIDYTDLSTGYSDAVLDWNNAVKEKAVEIHAILQSTNRSQIRADVEVLRQMAQRWEDGDIPYLRSDGLVRHFDNLTRHAENYLADYS